VANNLVQLIITARDQASSVFGRISNALGGLGRTGSGAGQDLGDALFGAIAKANLLGFALNKVGSAVSLMNAKFEEAKKIELGDVSAASTFSALTGKSFAESTKFVADFSKEISQIAGALPGATKDYNMVANSIMDNVIPAFKDANGVLDQGKFQQNLVDITKKMTLLGVQSDTHAQAVGMFTARLLDGNISSARQLLFADNNPAFMNVLEKEVEKRGKKLDDWKKFDLKQRLEIVQAVSGQFVKDEVIDAASNTVEGLIAGIESSFFDPKSGVFGLLRDLSSADGNQTVMSAVAEFIKTAQKFFEAGGRIMQALGVPNIDPMLVLYNGIKFVNSWVNKAATASQMIAAVVKGSDGGLQGLARIALQGLTQITQFFSPDKLLENLQGLLDGTLKWLNGFFEKTAEGSGNLLAAEGGAIGFATMGAKLGWFAGELVAKLVNFIINLPWANIFITIGNLALAIIPAIYGAYIAFKLRLKLLAVEAVFAIGKGLLSGLETFWIATTYTSQEVWNSINSEISNSISYYVNGWEEVFNFFIDGINRGFVDAYNSITNWVVNFGMQVVTSASQFFSGLMNSIAQMWSDLWAFIQNTINQFITQAKNSITQTVMNPISTVGSAVSSAATNVGNGISNGVGNVVSGVGNFLFGGSDNAMYGGHIPAAANGLLGAFNSEMRNMPSGAKPVVANTSEFILTPAQMQRLMQGSADVGASQGKNITFAPVISVNGGGDARAIASEVLQQLEIMFAQYQQEFLV
jgi:disulfide bond formation protein DsbB